MKIFHVSQEVCRGWDTFSDFVVIAKNEEDARKTHPYGKELEEMTSSYDSWPGRDKLSAIKVECIGTTKEKEKRVVCSSFHAG